VEFLPILAIIGIVVAFVFLSGSSKSEPPPESKPDVDFNPARVPIKPSVEKQPSPFDTKTAHPVKRQQTLVGAVYVTDGDTIII
jgi:hypothetical protein